jgi:hypothetical protein
VAFVGVDLGGRVGPTVSESVGGVISVESIRSEESLRSAESVEPSVIVSVDSLRVGSVLDLVVFCVEEGVVEEVPGGRAGSVVSFWTKLKGNHPSLSSITP